MSPAPKSYIQVHTPRNCECDLIWKKVLADVIQLRILRSDHLGLIEKMLNSAAHVLIRERRGEDADTEEKSQGKMDAKIGLMFPQAKKHLDSPEETGKDSPSELLGGVVCAKTLVSDFCCLELEIIHFRHFSCHVMGICLTAPGTLYTCVLCIILVILAPWETPFIHSFSAYYSLGPGNINTKRVSQCL